MVLPANGDRDLSRHSAEPLSLLYSQCSGGDLDGDDYTVIWAQVKTSTTSSDIRKDLIPENLNEEAMNYTARTYGLSLS